MMQDTCTCDSIDRVCSAYEEGSSALFLSGRSLHDIDLAADGRLRPIMEILRSALRQRFGMVLVTYSRAAGLDHDAATLDAKDLDSIERVLRGWGLLGTPTHDQETSSVLRGIFRGAREPAASRRWSDGREMRFAFLLEFCDHLVPSGTTTGLAPDELATAVELAHLLGNSLALRASGNLVMLHTEHGGIDDLVARALRRVRLPLPNREAKQRFVKAAIDVYDKAKLEEGLDSPHIARATENTPNRGLEGLLRASHRADRPLTAASLTEQRARDVEQMSEGTLTVLDSERVAGIRLVGVNIRVPMTALERFSQALRAGDEASPANVLLVGAQGIGKTDLAMLLARNANVTAYQMHSPKSSLVGETERKSRLQQLILREAAPNVAFVDEITEAFPLQRSDFDGDSGASRAVTGELLSALADETRRGRSLLVATTNCPWRMGAAMRSRFTVLPLLHPARVDFPDILVTIAKRIDPDLDLNPDDERVQEAAREFYRKGATPRHVRAALGQARLLHGDIDADTALFAARDLTPVEDMVSTQYADLWAVKACTSRSFLPWTEEPESYPYPAHLDGIVDASNGEIDPDALSRRIEELRPHANL
ncbi:AAA family ATPase [Candidatus Poribacteria bacterium]|jgi:hypothetical protein|nr:AAA family ATPase [Candidatus Poribacteria bacterium]